MINNLWIFFLVITLSIPAYAQELKPLYQPQNLSQQAFETQTEPIFRENEDDVFSSFSMRGSPDWVELTQDQLKNYAKQGRVYGDVAIFYGSPHPKGRESFVIKSNELPHDIYLKHWIIRDVLERGASLRSIEEYDDGRIETIIVAYEGEQTLVERTLFMINGSRVLQAKSTVPYERYAELRDKQARLIENFKFTKQDPNPTENHRIYTYLDLRSFTYPQSLIIEDGNNVSERQITLGFILKDFKDFIKGTMDLVIIKKEEDLSLKEVVETRLEKYKNRSLERKNLIEVKDYNLNDMFKFESVEVYGLSLKSSEYLNYEDDPVTQELWVAILSDGEYFYLLTLVTTARDLDVYSWSRATKAFETILTSIRKAEEF